MSSHEVASWIFDVGMPVVVVCLIVRMVLWD